MEEQVIPAEQTADTTADLEAEALAAPRRSAGSTEPFSQKTCGAGSSSVSW